MVAGPLQTLPPEQGLLGELGVLSPSFLTWTGPAPVPTAWRLGPPPPPQHGFPLPPSHQNCLSDPFGRTAGNGEADPPSPRLPLPGLGPLSLPGCSRPTITLIQTNLNF